MSDCEFLQTCPIFAKFHSEGIKNLWINTYCKGTSENCERKKLKVARKDVPKTMLPNGTFSNLLE